MSRLKKQERQKQLQEKLNITPFLTDEELATHFNVSVPTIRLDRLELGIPELRERIRVMATGQSQEAVEHVPYEVVGELIDVTEGQQALSMLRTTSDMEDRFGYVDVILVAYHGLKAVGKATGTIDKNDPDIL